jgi:hypothetical protein
MSTASASLARPEGAARPRAGVGPLARIELARLARHPVLIVGFVFGVVSMAGAVQEAIKNPDSDIMSMPVTSLTVGVPAMICAHLLTRSFDRADELVGATPTSRVARTAALCATAAFPAALAVLWLAFYGIAQGSFLKTPEWQYGTLSHADVWAVIVGNTVVAAVGGTLLGIASGRWWHFRGAAVVLVLGVAAWTLSVIGIFSAEGTPAPWYRWVRLFTPVAAFSNPAPDGNGADTLTGSPWWYLAWVVTLCALAAVAALLIGSEGATRRRLVRVGAAALTVSALTYGLAAAGGNSHAVRTYPDGHTVVLTP